MRSKSVVHLAMFIIALSFTYAAIADPVVSNVRASQRSDGTGMVDVWYDLSSAAGPCMVSLCFSNNNGVNWNVLPAQSLLQGDYGNGITNGVNKHITWDAGRDRPQTYWPQTKAKVTASETGQSITIMLPGSVPLVMMRIPAGQFTMGSSYDPPWSSSSEAPAHTVNMSYDFYLGKFEVTQEQWWAIMGNNPSSHQGAGLPVENISWNTIQTFITNLNGLGYGTFRLPSEAEWEYACRAGSNTRWCFGDDEAQLTNYAWYSANSSSQTHPVGTKLANAWGLYDMHGNVYEWVQDWYHSNYTGAPTDGSAWESPTGTSRVLRGGNCIYSSSYCRSAYRYFYYPDYALSNFGFRLLRTP